MPHPDIDLAHLRSVAEAATWEFKRGWTLYCSVDDAEHIGTFSPANALALLDRLAASEREAAVLNESLNCLSDENERLDIDRNALTTRAEKAEAALEEINQAAHTEAVDKLMLLHPWERAWANTIALEVLRAYVEALRAQAAKGGKTDV